MSNINLMYSIVQLIFFNNLRRRVTTLSMKTLMHHPLRKKLFIYLQFSSTKNILLHNLLFLIRNAKSKKKKKLLPPMSTTM